MAASETSSRKARISKPHSCSSEKTSRAAPHVLDNAIDNSSFLSNAKRPSDIQMLPVSTPLFGGHWTLHGFDALACFVCTACMALPLYGLGLIHLEAEDLRQYASAPDAL